MNFLLVCGGSAGHINPALAIAAELRRIMPDAKILFVGAGKELEKKLIPHAGFHLVNIKMGGLKRGISPEELIYNAKTVRYLATAGIKAGKLLRRFAPNAVIGTGGYICYPILRKAAHMGIPTVIHGSDAIPGLTTKMLGNTVDKVLVSYPGLENLYKRPERVVYTGTPVRSGFIPDTRAPAAGEDAEKEPAAGEYAAKEPAAGEYAAKEPVAGEYAAKEPAAGDQKPHVKTCADASKPLVISFWGSQGADRMNETIAGFIKLNIDGGQFGHIHATGKAGGVAEMKNRLKRLGAPEDLPPGIEIREYIEDMSCVMETADLALCRAGASTLAELTVMGKPAVLVPSPYVPKNHQEANARQLEKAGGAVVLLEKDCTGEALYNTVSTLLADKDTLGKMSKAQKTLAAPDAVEKIVKEVLSLCDND